MQPIESMQVFNAIPPAAIKDNAAFVSRAIDTAVAGGAQALAFFVSIGSIDADIAALKIMQSDTLTNATTLGGTPDQVLDILEHVVPGDDDQDQMIVLVIDLKGPRKRYVQLQATAGDGAAGTYLSAVAVLTNVGVPQLDIGALKFIRH